MIYDLPDTTTGDVNRKLIDIRVAGGAVALGRVMTLIIVTDDGPAEHAIRAANEASREHPCRIIAVIAGDELGSGRLDAQLRVGGDAGASEVIVLRLAGPLVSHAESVVVPFLLPDAPVVAWWPGPGPAVPAADPVGRMAQRRITDSAACDDPLGLLRRRAAGGHASGDTDLAWSRITLWRGLLASALDAEPAEEVTGAVVTGAVDSPSAEIMAAWLRVALDCPVRRIPTPPGTGMVAVTLHRADGEVDLRRPDGAVGVLARPGRPACQVALAPRPEGDCVAEELRRLAPDDVFTDVMTRGLPLLAGDSPTACVPSATRPAS
jgi:glucose-6-phosphate dehydrogenase assembly protein OpcA